MYGVCRLQHKTLRISFVLGLRSSHPNPEEASTISVFFASWGVQQLMEWDGQVYYIDFSGKLDHFLLVFNILSPSGLETYK